MTLVVIALFSVSLLFASVVVIRQSARTYRHAIDTGRVTASMKTILSACLDFMFVRGRLNVVLSREEAVSDSDRAFLLERSSLFEEAMESGLAELGEYQRAAADRLSRLYSLTRSLRLEGMAEMEKPRADRNPLAKDRWFAQASRFLDEVGTEMSAISLSSIREGLAFTYQRLLVLAVAYRDALGIKASMVTSFMELGGIRSVSELSPMLSLNGRLDELWGNLELYAMSTDNPRIRDALANVASLCFGEYYVNLVACEAALVEGEKPPIDPKALVAQSVSALDSINLLLRSVFDEAMDYAKVLAGGALRSLVLGGTLFAWSLFMALVAPLLLRLKVFGPLESVLGRLRLACDLRSRGQRDGEADEIMVLSRAADNLVMEVMQEHEKNREIQKIADTDPLTGLYNRRAFPEIYQRRVGELASRGASWAVAMFDLDYFKAVNDTWGHAAGDAALRHFAAILSRGLRASDLACRYGGEEFLALVADTEGTSALAIVERIRNQLEKAPARHEGADIALRVSVGLYAASPQDDPERAIQRSDEALYQAKASGRNRTTVWGGSS